jgi:chemotaxis signal transduction protein
MNDEATKRPAAKVIDDLVTELASDSLDNDTIKELISGLRQKHPDHEILKILEETLDNELNQGLSESDYQWIIFSIDGIVYGINSKFVMSIESLGAVTHVIDYPAYSPGFTYSREKKIDLVDLRVLFGSGDYISAKVTNPEAGIMMLVVELDGEKKGLIVDKKIESEHVHDFEKTACREGSTEPKFVNEVARREKTNEPVLILRPETFTQL